MASVDFHQVSHSYDGDQLALDGLDLHVAQGEAISIVGPSGCGKSSLLLMACGLLQPTSGEVLIDGRPISSPRQQTALVLQGLGLLPWKTVRANVELGLRLRKVDRAARNARVDEALASVGLLDQADRYPAQLSGGMRQRVAIARSLALDCDLLLMDEPLSALDALLRETIQDLLLRLHGERGYAQVLVTHSIEESVFLGRRVVVMTPHPGRVAHIFDNPGQGAADYRGDPAFFELCGQVRDALVSSREGGVSHE